MPIAPNTPDATWTPGDSAWLDPHGQHAPDSASATPTARIPERVVIVAHGGADAPRVRFADGTEATVRADALSASRPASAPAVRLDTTPAYWQECWLPGEEAWFEYRCNESADSPDAPAWFHSHQRVVVLSDDGSDEDVPETAGERLEGGWPRTYRVRFSDGLEWTAFEDELLTSREGFSQAEPPRLVRDEPVDLAGFARVTGLALETLRTYRKDGRLPKPDGTFGRIGWWYRTTVQMWEASRAEHRP